MPPAFDPSEYLRAPVISVSSGVALALALVQAAPKDTAATVTRALKKMKTTTEKARDTLAERTRVLGAFTDEDSRALDNEADRAWGGMRLRLQALAMLDPATSPRAKRAAAIDALLFSGGMEFLKADYASQATSMAALLDRIERDDLAGEIDGLAGKEFLQAIRAVQPRYEAMVTERLRRDKATGQNLLDTTRQLQAAIVSYATKLIGTMDEEDPASVEAVRVALLPIANHRRNAVARRTAVDVPPAPEPTGGGTNPA